MDPHRREPSIHAPEPERQNIFNDLRLGGLDWKRTAFNPDTGNAEFTVQAQLGSLELRGVLSREKGTGGWIDHYEFEVFTGENERILGGTVIFYNPHDRSIGTIDAGIERYDRSGGFSEAAPVLPKGSGIAFYEKLLDFMQYTSNDDAASYQHTVKARPKGMSAENWDEHFAPVLRERGYTEERWGRWEKVYSPQY